MECHSVELKKERFIKELSVDNRKTSVRVDKLIDVALLLIELAILCFTHFSVDLWATTVSSSLNISHLIY
jgi:hypothetical protein